MTALNPPALAVPALAGRPRSRRLAAASDLAVRLALFGCAAFSVLTTAGIIAVLCSETVRFFVSPAVTLWEFLTGGQWSPLLGSQKHFGIWPLVCGTMLVTAVAALVSLPFGLITALYLSEYAPRRLRAMVKPVLEILAGVPTVVYGFFALTVITPFLRSLHGGFEVYNAASAGIAVGVMCLPIVCSLSEDSLQAVPRSLREAAYAVGATKFDVSVRIVVPAALSGVMAAFLLAIARAIGETMIVAIAAGGLAQLTLDPRQSVQTMTAYMVQIFLGDASNFGPEYSSAYAVAASLFVMTLVITILSQRVLARYREAYH
jgi:phosphate transport system permease protein